MNELSVDDLVLRAADAGLAERRAMTAALGELGEERQDLDAAIGLLQKKGLLTTLQAEKLIRGDRHGYFYGDYKVQYLIGAGTFARVYRAEKDGNVFAIKVLRKRFRDEIKEMEQFLREGRMGLTLSHPNIVRIYDVVDQIHNPFLVMEFVEGQTLRELVRIRGALPAKMSLALMMGIASGLAHAASFGISHRDLKLSNVLISSEGKAKLVDFGLAALSDRSNPDKVADCPNARAIDYATLERSTGVRKDDPRSDVFFAGNMLYHMIAGQPALTETRDRLARMNVTRFQDIKPLHELVPDVPGVANHVVRRSLQFNPEKRLQTAAALQAECKKALEFIAAGRGGRVDDKGEIQIEGFEDQDAPNNEGEGHVVLLVESKQQLQDVIRQRLKSRGYRVLVISHPARALARFTPEDDPPADCVIFSAAELGGLALEAYNEFASGEVTAGIPSILLVDRRQQHIISNAVRGENRKLLALPLKVRELRAGLMKLLEGTPRRPPGMI